MKGKIMAVGLPALVFAINIIIGTSFEKHGGFGYIFLSKANLFKIMGLVVGLTFVFGILLKWFVPGGYVSYDTNFGGFLGYMIFPAIAIALPKIAMTVKLFRSSLLQEKKKEYVRTAYSKGNNTRGVLYGHILKNALIPVITFLGMVLTDMIAGSIIIEQVFNIPGLGRILLTSISNRDYPVVEAIVLCIAVLVIVVNFLVDVLYHVIDPRMRTE